MKVERDSVWRWARIVLAAAVVVGIFVAIIPRIATYSDVWRSLTSATGAALALVGAAALANLVTYWVQSVAAMPGLTIAQAAVLTQTTTTVANTVPGGGGIAVGVGFGLLRSWGFSDGRIALYTLVTGVWNTFVKLAMPVLALALLALEGRAGGSLLAASIVGVLALAISIALSALALRTDRYARAIGDRLARLASALVRPFGRPPVTGWGRAAVRFRRRTIDLLRRRWGALTAATVVSHFSLFLVLLASLRALGVSQDEVTWIEALGVFAFGRLVTALPVTPGGLGVVELTYIGGLVVAGGERADVVAAVLLFRALTYGLQIPLGALAYPFARAVAPPAPERRRRAAEIARGAA